MKTKKSLNNIDNPCEPQQDKKIAFRYFGCRLNLFESSALETEFLSKGYQKANEKDAHWIVINTCAVTKRAEEKNRQAIRRLHRENPLAKIVLSGCYANQKPKQLEQMAGVHLVVENEKKANLFSLINNPQEANLNSFNSLQFSYQQKPKQSRAYLKIQDGCNRSCSYCQIPFSRGAAISRPLAEVRQELKKILAYGFSEIVLTGVNLGDYHFVEKGNFAKLVRYNLFTLMQELALEQSKQDWYFRLGSLEPDTITQEILTLYRTKKLAAFLHAPLQSGSNAILGYMQRDYRRHLFDEKIAMIHSLDMDIRISSDVIVGFVGEQEPHFQETIAAVKKNFISNLHVFPYSKRPHTAIENIAKQYSLTKPSKEETDNRIKQLAGLKKELSQKYKNTIEQKSFRAIVEQSQNKFRFFTENNYHVDSSMIIGKQPQGLQHGQMIYLQKLKDDSWQFQ